MTVFHYLSHRYRQTARTKIFTSQTISSMAEQGLTSDYHSNVAEFSFHAGVMSNARDRYKPERLSR